MSRFVKAALLGVVTTGAVSPLTAQTAAFLDSTFRQWNSTSGPGCTVGVDFNGQRTTRAYGMANLEYGIALQPNSIIESGSVAKQFATAAAALLHIRGRLSLDDDIRKYLPELKDFGTTITIRQLFSHTSGLRDQWALLGLQGIGPGQAVHTLPWILDLASHQEDLNYTPGSRHLYSNMGYVLSAIIMERVLGEPFARFSEREFFAPLGMTRTQWRDDYRRVVPDRATAYSREGNAWVQDMPFTMVHGNGGLLTTVEDLLRWNEALTKGTIPGGAELVRMLETPPTLTDGTTIRYALGLSVDDFRGIRMVSHGGSTAGYRTYLARWPDRNLSVAVLCNAAQANPTGYTTEIVGRLLGVSTDREAPGSPVTVSRAELAPLAGVYRDSTNDQIVRITLDGDRLVATPGGPLTPLGNGQFWSASMGTARFVASGSTWRLERPQDGWGHFIRDEVPESVRAADYVGKYRSPELEVTYEVASDSAGGLTLKIRRVGTMPLRPAYRDGFTVGGGRTVRFTRDRRGTVTGFKVFAGRALGVRFNKLP
ncbi:MAG: serine hydrolase domain-containing protein [Gemmatimonadales bacterium]